jgi:site-specific recombinase XerD
VELADDYLLHLRRQGRARGTVRAYSWILEKWVLAMIDQGAVQPGDVTLRHVERWQDQLGAVSLATQSIAISAVRGMLRWAGSRHLVDPTIWTGMVQVRVPAHLPRPLAEVDLDRLLAHFRRRPRDLVPLRDRALFFYLFTTGARISEALQVDRDAHGKLDLVTQKGGSQKFLVAAPIAHEAIADYLRAREDDHPALWITHDNNRPTRRLDPAGVREIWRRVAERLGMRRFTTHQLRHSCATEMLDQGVREVVIAEHLGHANLNMMKRYAQVRTAQRETAVQLLQDRIAAPVRPPGVLRSIDRRSR